MTLGVLIKAGGPYIGPRGGKWADAAHTVPWKEGKAQRGAKPISVEKEIGLSNATERKVTDTLKRLAARFPEVGPVKVQALGYATEHVFATKSSGSLKLNPHFWSDDTKLSANAKEWDGLLYDSSVEGVVTHEFGHMMAHRVLNKIGSEKYNQILGKHVSNPLALSSDETTPYGMENTAEFEAESFAIYVGGKPHIDNELGHKALATSQAFWRDMLAALRGVSKSGAGGMALGVSIDAISKAMGPPPSSNRKKYPFVGTLHFHGILIYVENVPGSIRSGFDRDGEPWATQMQLHYGEIPGTHAVDGDPVDVYVGTDFSAETAYVVHQFVDGYYDEDKVMLGFPSKEEAVKAYQAHYDKPMKIDVTTLPVSDLKNQVYSGKLTLGIPVLLEKNDRPDPLLDVFGKAQADPEPDPEPDPDKQNEDDASDEDEDEDEDDSLEDTVEKKKKSKIVKGSTASAGTVLHALENGVFYMGTIAKSQGNRPRIIVPERYQGQLLTELAPVAEAAARDAATEAGIAIHDGKGNSEAYNALLKAAYTGIVAAVGSYAGDIPFRPHAQRCALDALAKALPAPEPVQDVPEPIDPITAWLQPARGTNG